jgi:hypothetical protein
MVALEALQSSEGLRNPAQVPLAHRDEVQDIAVFGYFEGKRLSCPQSLGVLVALEKVAYAANFWFHV